MRSRTRASDAIVSAPSLANQSPSDSRYAGFVSACADRQTAADAEIDGTFQGAATWAFLRVLCRADGTEAHALRDFAPAMQRELGTAFAQRVSCSAADRTMLTDVPFVV